LFVTDLSHLESNIQKSSSKTLIIGLWPDAESQTSIPLATASGVHIPRLDIVLGQEKIGAKKLRLRLSEIIHFVEQYLYQQENENVVGRKDVQGLESSTDIHWPTDQYTVKSPLNCAEDDTYNNATDKDTIPPTKSIIQDRPDHLSLNEHVVITQKSPMDTNIIIACESGKQVSIGVALAIACLFFDDAGNPLTPDSKRPSMNKSFVASRLAWFSTSMPGANPSRDVLQSVRRYLFERDG
jgi:hypothetical protein